MKGVLGALRRAGGFVERRADDAAHGMDRLMPAAGAGLAGAYAYDETDGDPLATGVYALGGLMGGRALRGFANWPRPGRVLAGMGATGLALHEDFQPHTAELLRLALNGDPEAMAKVNKALELLGEKE